jgi:hypothetical protein
MELSSWASRLVAAAALAATGLAADCSADE